MAKEFRLGDPVFVTSGVAGDDFGGLAVVVGLRDLPESHYKVWMADRNPPDPFWAFDSELGEPPADLPYDSRVGTLDHILYVRAYLARMVEDLQRRAEVHDLSKLESPEREVFDEFTPKLKGSTYGSDEYKSFLAGMKRGLDHHYAANSHHPEHYPDGIRGMSLLDLVEMLCDWKAATLRHADGDIRRSIEINQARFGYSDELKQILLNTLSAVEGGSIPRLQAGGV